MPNDPTDHRERIETLYKRKDPRGEESLGSFAVGLVTHNRGRKRKGKNFFIHDVKL